MRTLDVALTGGDISGENFGLNRPGTLGDTIYSDADGDGVQDLSEPGIQGVTVELVDLGSDGVVGGGDDTVVETTTTDASGGYQFANLSEGDYAINVTDTAGVLAGTTNTGDPDGGADSSSVVTLVLFDHDSNALTPDIVSSDFDQDFGYQDPTSGSISGTVVS